ncbi:DUF4244 domain-containing protein [Nocardiopsis dassonvillei]|uniref:DUF4244 domain-containing protein n=1 Tax=Nocardiopsis dassonvillei TaxID=2014 RepID=UPI00102B5A47|nr:DUF4244 domain-containing protein [Nocardiopsis dassonvillei]MCP3015368.1 DUF4244 domain-containing protein [Nocardiopsis dassonvillei]
MSAPVPTSAPVPPPIAAPPPADAGMTTSEYAFCTIAAVAFAGVLYAVLTSGAVEDVLTDLVVNALGSGF